MAQEAGLPADQKQILEPLDIVNIFEPHEMDEIVVEIMRLSGFMSDDKVTVVTDALKTNKRGRRGSASPLLFTKGI